MFHNTIKSYQTMSLIQTYKIYSQISDAILSSTSCFVVVVVHVMMCQFAGHWF